MKPDADSPEPRLSFRGSASVVVAVAVVAILLIWLPAYRLFFVISLAIGAVVAGILHLWGKYRPIKEEDVEQKRPLGLD
jgi:peptidoglycan biosynthesis protein MviN/MurJ (putative lipid II flippase)